MWMDQLVRGNVLIFWEFNIPFQQITLWGLQQTDRLAKCHFLKTFQFQILPQKCVNHNFISFHDKTHKSFFCDNSICHCWLGLVHQIGIFLSIWENSACGKTVSLKWVVFLRYPMSEACMYVTCKQFTPNPKIFYAFLGFWVKLTQVPGVKLPLLER